MSFSYFEALPADVKAQLSFSEVEDLIRVFQHFDKAREGVLDKGTAPNDFAREVANKLGERFGNANGFLDALMAHTAPTLPFADLAKVTIPCSYVPSLQLPRQFAPCVVLPPPNAAYRCSRASTSDPRRSRGRCLPAVPSILSAMKRGRAM